MDDSGMAGVVAIGAIFRKGVFKGTISKNQKSGIEIGLTVSVYEPSLVASTKLEAEGLERAGEIEDDSISGSS